MPRLLAKNTTLVRRLPSYRLFLLTCTIPASLALTPLPIHGQGNQPPDASRPACEFIEKSREILRDDNGYEMYVEPTVLSRSGNALLLAGVPNYFFVPGPSGSELRIVQDSLIGAVVSEDGRVRAIPSPVHDGIPMSVRAAPHPGGGWDVVFAEFDRTWVFGQQEQLLHLWSAKLDQNGLSDLREIPLPPGLELVTFNASALIRHGDTLSLAMVHDTRDQRTPVLFQRIGDRWTSEVIGIPSVAQALLAHSTTHGLILALVRSMGVGDRNSLQFYTRSTAWEALRLVVDGRDVSVYSPELTFNGPRGTLSWSTLDRRGHVMIGELELRNSEIVQIGDVAARLGSLALRRGPSLWIIQRGPAQGYRVVDLHFLSSSAGEAPRLFHSMDNPFDGLMGVVELSDGEVLLSGPLLRPTMVPAALVTSLIRAEIRCTR